MKEIQCIFCGIGSDQVVIEENGFKGRKCPQCGLIYISPRPSLNEIIDLYGHDDASISAETHISDAFTKRLYARHNLGIIRQYIQRGTLLEIGSGAGYFLDEALKAGFTPHGIEFNPIQAEFIRSELKLPCEQTPLQPGIFGGSKFDVVYHCDVSSHFFDPVQEFRNMHAVMKDNAFLIFETGNLGEVDVANLRYVKYFQYPDHLFFFNPKNLETLLEMAGFEVVRIYRYSIFPQLFLRDRVATLKRRFKRSKQSTQVEIKPPQTESASLPNNVDQQQETKIASVIEQKPTLKRHTVPSSAKDFKNYLIYLFRYKLGYILPKKKLPQTLIIVARKLP